MSKKKKKRKSSRKSKRTVRQQDVKELTAVSVAVLVFAALVAVSSLYDSYVGVEAVSEDTVFSDEAEAVTNDETAENISGTEDVAEILPVAEDGPETDTEEADTPDTESGDGAKNEAKTVAPVITGVGTVSAFLGDSPEYLDGISAADGDGNDVAVTYDPSSVDVLTPGKYGVQYFAVDGSGNVGKEWGIVEIKSADQDTVDALADGILEYILTDGMTERERARAVYDWCVGNIIYSAGAGFQPGKNTDGAYAGLKNRRGNCFVYYSTASELLSRAGITNIMIKRTSETDPHYWNLVRVDGEWYHFDSCPHFADYPLEAFLLTDVEVREYSENEVEDYYSFDAALYPATP